jgi:hypothetical protein
MVQFGFTTLYQTSFKSAFTTVRFIIICNNYKSHWYNINWGFFVSSALEFSNAEFGINAITAYWQAYYQLRTATLYDIHTGRPLYNKNIND